MGVTTVPLRDDPPAPKSGSSSGNSSSSSSNNSSGSILDKTTTVTVYGSLDTTEKLASDKNAAYHQHRNHHHQQQQQQQQQLSAKDLLDTDSKETHSEDTQGSSSSSGKDLVAEETEEGCCVKFTSCRWVIGYMCCAARFSQSAIRQCIGLAVVCMTLNANKEGGEATGAGAGTGTGTGDGGLPGQSQVVGNLSGGGASSGGNAEVTVAEFRWSPEFEGLVLNAFNMGLFVSPIIGGHIAGKIGGKRVILVSLLVGSLATICLPVTARYNDIFVFVLRLIAGIFLGSVDPAIQALWSRWAPKTEKAQLTTCSYTGFSLAGIATFFISGHLCGVKLQNGWPFIFYFFGGFALVCTIPWLFLVYDSPDQHPRILESEQRLIARGKGQNRANKNLATPWKQMLTSGPLWAIVVAHMTYSWMTTWIMAYLPKYLRDVMKFNMDEDGLYSSLPFAGRLVTGFVASYLSDRVTRSGRLSTARTRKMFQTIGCVSCAACTLAVGFVDSTSRATAVTLLVLAMSFQNLTSVAFRINHLDIAPRFAGVMMGMTLTAAMAFSLTAPPITAAIVRQGTKDEWQCLFIIVATLNLVGAAVFEVFGSGEIQDWAQPPKTDYSPMSVVSIDIIADPNSVPEDRNPGEGPPKGTAASYCVGEDSDNSTASTDMEEDSDSHASSNSEQPSSRLPVNSAVTAVGEKTNNFSPSRAGTNEKHQKDMNTPRNPTGSDTMQRVSQVEDKVSDPNGDAPKHQLLRKRVSSSDLPQLDASSKKAASVKPTLPPPESEPDPLRIRPE